MKAMKPEYLKLALLISILLLISACVYIGMEKVDLYETVKNESYALGFNQGLEQWNFAVISNVNTKGAIPYFFNGSYFELNIAQMCDSVE